LETAFSSVLTGVMIDGDVLALTINGPARFKEDFESNPPRLILDLVGVKSALGKDFLMPSSPRILKISALARPGEPPMLRLTVQLKQATSYEVAAQPPGLVVHFIFPADEKTAP